METTPNLDGTFTHTFRPADMSLGEVAEMLNAPLGLPAHILGSEAYSNRADAAVREDVLNIQLRWMRRVFDDFSTGFADGLRPLLPHEWARFQRLKARRLTREKRRARLEASVPTRADRRHARKEKR